jgi:hypothetical protein
MISISVSRLLLSALVVSALPLVLVATTSAAGGHGGALFIRRRAIRTFLASHAEDEP